MNWFDDAVDFFDEIRSSPWGQQTIAAYIDFISPDLTWTALDIGCGAGNFSMTLAQRVDRVSGIDQSPKMIGRAQQKCAESKIETCEFMIGDATAIPYPDGTFDLVTTMSVLYLLDDEQHMAAAEMVRALADGGIIALHEPTPEMNPSRMERFIANERRNGRDVPDITGWAQAAVSHTPLTEERLDALFAPFGYAVTKSRRLFGGMAMECIMAKETDATVRSA